MATTYMVLRLNGAKNWAEVGEYEAVAAPKAERTAAETTGVEGVYVAVPVRSWKPGPQNQQVTTRWTSGAKITAPPAAPVLPLGTREQKPSEPVPA